MPYRIAAVRVIGRFTNFLHKNTECLISPRAFGTSIQDRNVHIDVTPKEALLDSPPIIRVEGCESNQKVTLWNSYTDDSGIVFSSHAHYISNDKGVVDVRNDMSYGGKYKGVFAEGLVSSLHAAPPAYENKDHLKWARLHKKDVTQPLKYTLKIVDGHVSEQELYSRAEPKKMGETIFLRHLMDEGVRRVEIEENDILGTLFLPPGDGPFPVILDLFGAESGIKEFRSAMLASKGYASLVLPYYSYKSLPTLTDRINLEYFLRGIDFLNNFPQGFHEGIGLIGSSKGGEIGLTIASLTDKIKACVTINSYHKSIDIDYYLNDKLFLEKVVGDQRMANIHLNKEGKLVAYGKSHFYFWDIQHILPIDKVPDDCHILLAAGDSDGGHGHRSAMTLKERAYRRDKKNVSVVIYPGTGHLIDPPFHAHIDAVWNTTILIRKPDGSKFKGLPHYYGGNPYDMCQAAKDLWRRTLGLFHRRLVLDAGLPVHTTKLYPPY